MAINDPLATFAEYQARTGVPDNSDQTVIEAHILTASGLMQRFTGRSFNATTGVRYYDGNGRAELYVADFTAITEIALDTDGDGVHETVLGATWIGRPYEAADLSEPYTSVELMPYSGAEATVFPAGSHNVKITGTHGWAAVPGAIRDATVIIARQLRELAESGLTLTVQASDEELRVMPGAFSLLTAMQTEYGRRMPGFATL